MLLTMLQKSTEEADQSNCSDLSDLLNLEDDEGWGDIEPDVENVRVVSLFENETFPDIHSMLRHCRTRHNFDLVKLRNELGV